MKKEDEGASAETGQFSKGKAWAPVERAQLEAETLEAAKRVKGLMPEGRGFALFTFDFGPKGYVAYASTAPREDMIVAVGKWFLNEMSAREGTEADALLHRIAHERRLDDEAGE